jgi:Leucine-rich repeat (LRR) protein
MRGETFECSSFDDLTQLDNYHDIVYIHCHNNKLHELPTLPHSLLHLGCSYNKLTILPNLPNSLILLNCSQNELTFLPSLPQSLIELYCECNKFEFIPKFRDSLRYKCYVGNPVHKYIKDTCGGDLAIYHRENEIFATKLVRWYLDCRENPIFKFCRARLDREYDDLFKEDVDGIMA